MLATVPAHSRGVTGGTRFDRLGGALLHAILRRNIRRDDCVDWKGIGVGAKKTCDGWNRFGGRCVLEQRRADGRFQKGL